MRNGYILLTEALLSLTKSRGRIQQVETKIVKDGKAHHLTAVTELTDVRAKLNEMADMLVEVQGMLTEPTKGDIIAHYDPATRNVPLSSVDAHELKGTPKPLTLDPEAFLGYGPGKGKTEYLDDKRPAGWTEALALEFIAESLELDSFANLFLHGQWPAIQKEWPEFQTWINTQLEGNDELIKMWSDEPAPAPEPIKPEQYDSWVSSECMMALSGLDMVERFGNVDVDLPQDKLDLLGRVLNAQRKDLTERLSKKLDKVVIHAPE